MEFVVPKYSKTAVDRAGRALVDPRSFDLHGLDEALDVIDNWRSSHAYPLNTFQVTLRNKSRTVDTDAVVAQRIKRLTSIAAKLRRFPTMTLSQMQDLGGCRAIVKNVKSVNALRDLYAASRFDHELHTEDNYIRRPKASGYRGIHLIYKYRNSKLPQYNGLKIEIQLRTVLQHAWATAVETVDTFTRQALKSSVGDAQWLRFFAIMSSAIASLEKSKPVSGTPTDKQELIRELAAHVIALDVFNRLTAYGSALRTIEVPSTGNARYFLLELDPVKGETVVTGYRANQLDDAEEHYLRVERERGDGTQRDAVLVSVESIKALRRAYPNYFLDTQLFLRVVERVIGV